MAKSYHSRTLPIMPATITLRVWAKFIFASPNGNARECIVFSRIVYFRNATAALDAYRRARQRCLAQGATNGDQSSMYGFTSWFHSASERHSIPCLQRCSKKGQCWSKDRTQASICIAPATAE